MLLLLAASIGSRSLCSLLPLLLVYSGEVTDHLTDLQSVPPGLRSVARVGRWMPAS